MNIDAITTAVQSGQFTHQQAIHLYAALTQGQVNPPALQLPCEECGTVMPLSHIVSYKVWVAMPGHPAVAGFDEHDQHFCCSHDCAEKSIANCVAGHLRPEAERRCEAARLKIENGEHRP